jgi:predicted  nucleic acid-binding Zn-ribbon protein
MRRLEELPGRVDALTSQSRQLRGSLQEEFSAMRSMITVIDSRLVANDSRLGPIDSKLVAIDTRVGDVQDRLEQTRTEMRVLHEEAIARLTLLREWQEAQPRTRSRQRKK